MSLLSTTCTFKVSLLTMETTRVSWFGNWQLVSENAEYFYCFRELGRAGLSHHPFLIASIEVMLSEDGGRFYGCRVVGGCHLGPITKSRVNFVAALLATVCCSRRVKSLRVVTRFTGL